MAVNAVAQLKLEVPTKPKEIGRVEKTEQTSDFKKVLTKERKVEDRPVNKNTEAKKQAVSEASNGKAAKKAANDTAKSAEQTNAKAANAESEDQSAVKTEQSTPRSEQSEQQEKSESETVNHLAEQMKEIDGQFAGLISEDQDIEGVAVLPDKTTSEVVDENLLDELPAQIVEALPTELASNDENVTEDISIQELVEEEVNEIAEEVLQMDVAQPKEYAENVESINITQAEKMDVEVEKADKEVATATLDKEDEKITVAQEAIAQAGTTESAATASATTTTAQVGQAVSETAAVIKSFGKETVEFNVNDKASEQATSALANAKAQIGDGDAELFDEAKAKNTGDKVSSAVKDILSVLKPSESQSSNSAQTGLGSQPAASVTQSNVVTENLQFSDIEKTSKTAAITHAQQVSAKSTMTLNDPQLANRISERISWMIGQNIKQATVRLDPVGLGPMKIHVNMQGAEQAQVNFVAQHGVTRDILDSAIPRLRELMQLEGLNLVDVNVQAESGESELAQQEEQHTSSRRGKVDDGGNEQPEEEVTVYQDEGLVDYYA